MRFRSCARTPGAILIKTKRPSKHNTRTHPALFRNGRSASQEALTHPRGNVSVCEGRKQESAGRNLTAECFQVARLRHELGSLTAWPSVLELYIDDAPSRCRPYPSHPHRNHPKLGQIAREWSESRCYRAPSATHPRSRRWEYAGEDVPRITYFHLGGSHPAFSARRIRERRGEELYLVVDIQRSVNFNGQRGNILTRELPTSDRQTNDHP